MRSPHDATLFIYKGEVEDKASYEPLYLKNVRCDFKSGVTVVNSKNVGLKEKVMAQIYVYFEDVKTTLKYAPEWEYSRLNDEGKENYWTIDSEHDMICGDILDEPDKYTFKITDVLHCYNASGELHHLEITGT